MAWMRAIHTKGNEIAVIGQLLRLSPQLVDGGSKTLAMRQFL